MTAAGRALSEGLGRGVSAGVQEGLDWYRRGLRDKAKAQLAERKAQKKRIMQMAKDLSKSMLYKATDSPFNSKENVASRKSLVMATLVNANRGESIGPGLKHMVDFWVQQDADQIQVMAKAWRDKALKGQFDVTTMVNLGRKGQPPGALPAYIKKSLAEDKQIRGREAIQGFMGQGRAQTALQLGPGQPPRGVQIPRAASERAVAAGNLDAGKALLAISKSRQALNIGQSQENRAIRNQQLKEQELERTRGISESDENRKDREDANKIIERARAVRNQVIKESDRVRRIGREDEADAAKRRTETRTILKESEARLQAGITNRRNKELDVRSENEESRKAAKAQRDILEAELAEVHRILQREQATIKEQRLADTAARNAFEKSPAGIERRLKAEAASKKAIFMASEVPVQDKRFLGFNTTAPLTQHDLVARGVNVPRDTKVVQELNQKENALRKAHSTISSIIQRVEGKPERLSPAGAIAGFLTSIQRGTVGLMNLIPGIRDFVVPDSAIRLLDNMPGLNNLGKTAKQNAIIKSSVIGLTYQVGALSGQVSRAFSDFDYQVNAERIAAGTANDKVMVAVLRSMAIAQNEAYAQEFFNRTGVKKRINIPNLDQDDPFGDLDTEGMKGVLVELLPTDAYKKFKDAEARLKKRYDPGGNF